MEQVFKNESPENHPQALANDRPVFRQASYSQSDTPEITRGKKHTFKSVSPVDWYLYRKLPEVPEPVTISWVTIGYADTRYTGTALILTSKGKTIGDGYVSTTHKVMVEVKHKVDPSTQEASADVTHGLDRF